MRFVTRFAAAAVWFACCGVSALAQNMADQTGTTHGEIIGVTPESVTVRDDADAVIELQLPPDLNVTEVFQQEVQTIAPGSAIDTRAGARALLVPGAHVSASVRWDSGVATVVRISVGRDDFTPPQ